jgi:hypothetical protein
MKKKIGVVGYSGAKFDEKIAKALLAIAFDVVEQNFDSDDGYELVSGLTDVGIPGLAYRMAVKEKWETVGLSAKEAKEYDCFPVDEEIIVGEKFGDESKDFIEYIDCLIRIGGGKQSFKETEMARKKGIPVFEYDLPEIK